MTAAALGLAALLTACGTNPQRSAPATTPKPVNMAGHWEMNFTESDDVNRQLNAMVRELNRTIAREQALSRSDARSGPALSVGGGRNTPQAILGLAQLGEVITRSQLLEITQDANRVRIHRDQDFALACDYSDTAPVPDQSSLGTEICGWDAHQLVFSAALRDEGLRIVHRFSLGGQGNKLLVSTSISSAQVSEALTINRVFDRYDPSQLGYQCEMTMTRGRVCRTGSD